MNGNIILRMRDVAVCLYHAQKRSIVLSRIQLQKIIYLQDCINAFLYILPVDKGHITYYHGPYDKNIQNAADSLVFYMLAEADNIRVKDTDISCEYRLTNDGIRWIDSLIKEDTISNKSFIITKGLIDSLITRNLLNRVVDLVYAEPLFVKNKRNGYWVDLDFSDLDSNDVFSFLTIVLDVYSANKQTTNIDFICDLVIKYLHERTMALAISNVEV